VYGSATSQICQRLRFSSASRVQTHHPSNDPPNVPTTRCSPANPPFLSFITSRSDLAALSKHFSTQALTGNSMSTPSSGPFERNREDAAIALKMTTTAVVAPILPKRPSKCSITQGRSQGHKKHTYSTSKCYSGSVLIPDFSWKTFKSVNTVMTSTALGLQGICPPHFLRKTVTRPRLKTTWQQHSHPNALKATMTVMMYLALYPQYVYYDDERNNDCLASWVRSFFISFFTALDCILERDDYCIVTTLPTLVSYGYDPTP
jgi:hypothetical protein